MAAIRQDKQVNKWIVDFKRGKVRKRFYFNTRREAEEFKKTLVLRGLGIGPEEGEIKPISVAEAVERYLQTVTVTKGKATQYFERIVFREFCDFFHNTLIDDLSLADIQDYQAHLRRKRLGQSVNRRFNTLCHFFNQCSLWHLVRNNPAENLKRLPSTRQKAQRALTEGELRILLGAAKPWVRDILWFILVCGLRRSQACFIRWGAVDVRNKYVHLESSEGFDNKDYEANTLPLTETTEMMLKGLLEQASLSGKLKADDLVFLDDRGKQIRPDRLTKEGKKLLKATLGITSGAVHILRHTSLTLRHRQGVSLDAVRAIAGHSNVRTTMLYLHSEPEYLRKEMTRTPLVNPFWISPDLANFGENVAANGSEHKEVARVCK